MREYFVSHCAESAAAGNEQPGGKEKALFRNAIPCIPLSADR